MTTKKTAKKTPESTRPESVKAASPVAKKTVKPAAAKKTTAKRAAAKAEAKASPDMIARAAYLNYRRRVEQGLPGDSHGDWLEAERYFNITKES